MPEQFPVPEGWFIFGTHAGVDDSPEYLIFSRERGDDGYPFWERPGSGMEPVMQWAKRIDWVNPKVDTDPKVPEFIHSFAWEVFGQRMRSFGEKHYAGTSRKKSMRAALEAIYPMMTDYFLARVYYPAQALLTDDQGRVFAHHVVLSDGGETAEVIQHFDVHGEPIVIAGGELPKEVEGG